MKLKTSAILIAGVLIGAATIPAQANNDAMLELLKILHDKGTISSEDYKLLTTAAAADKEMSEAAITEMKKDAKEASAKIPNITTDGKLVVADKEGNWEFQPIGRVMWDALAVDNDGLYDGTSTSDNEGRGTELRRARLGFQGSVYDWNYKFEADFAGGDASIKDAYVGYGNSLTDTTKWGVKLGQSHIAFGYNTKASSKYMSFIDRPFFADSVLSPSRESGAAFQVNDKDYRWLLSTSFTSGQLDGGETDVDDADTFSVRGSFVPFMQDDKHLLQVGAGYLTRGRGEAGDTLRYRQRAVSHITSERPIDTRVESYDGSKAFTVDVLGIYGPFHALAEYVDYSAESNLTSDQEFKGYSVEAGYFLTGESYKWKKGYNSGVTPKSKFGAWQLVARFENIETDDDLQQSFDSDGDLVANNFGDFGDEADKFTLGVNYIPRKNISLMLNYDKITDLTVDGENSDAEPSALKFRAQAFW